ncbi:MAG: hypothetical protein IJI25_11110 [Eubacterium sp.]|nr:hypothetical protein [Eubacterium sp.]
MKLEMILKDGTTIELIEASYPKHYVMACKNAAAFKKAWNKMTEDNLSEIQIREEGETVVTLLNSHLAGTQTVNQPDGSLIGHFYMEGEIKDDEDNSGEPDDIQTVGADEPK